MKAWAIVLMLGVMALAGCTGDDLPEGNMTDSENTSSDGEGNDTISDETLDENSGNQSLNATIPIVSLTVYVPSLAPVNVIFNFSAQDFEDLEFVDWTLDVDSDGTPETEGFGGLPSNYTQTFTAIGNYTATFRADDGNNVAEIQVAFLVDGEPPLPPREQVTYNAEAPGSSTLFTLTASDCLTPDLGTTFDCVLIDIEDGVGGYPFTIAGSPSATYLDFLLDCDDWTASAGVFQADGIVPIGAACAVMWNYGPTVNNSFVLAL